MPTELIIDAQVREQHELLMEKARRLVGKWRVTFTEYRPRRTDRQNRYYWPAFVQPFGEFLRKCDVEIAGSLVTDLQSHAILKHKFLRHTAFNKVTGELLGDLTRSTTELSTVEFNEYLDRSAAYLLTEFDIDVPPPRLYHEREDERNAA